MKTIIENGSNISLYLLPDDNTDTLASLGIQPGTTFVVEGVTTPDNHWGYKYKYIDGAWVLNPNFEDPRDSVEEQ